MSTSFDDKTENKLWLTGAVFLAVIGFVYWQMNQLSHDLIRSNAIENASQLSTVIREFRTLYTSEVVRNAKKSGVRITHDYQSHEGAIPLPATLSMMLGNRLAARGGGKTRLFSEFPFPWRAEERGALSQLDLDTIDTLRADPKAHVVRLELLGEDPWIYYATADLMREACVNCHNSHPQTPRNDWKVGDVRGVVEVSVPLKLVIARTQASFDAIRWLVGLGTMVVLGILAYLGRTIIDRSNALAEGERRLGDETMRRTRVEFELEQSKLHKGFILDSADEAIIAMDKDGLITEFNHAAEKIFGFPRNTAIGSRVTDLVIPASSYEAHKRGVQQILADHTRELSGKRIEVNALHADGNEFPIEISITKASRDGEVSFIACMHDISDRIQQEDQLRGALDEAEQSRVDLEAFNHFSVDRELRMVDLKTEVNNLLVDNGSESKYDVSDDEELQLGGSS